MLLMPTRALKEGMILAQPIFHPRADSIVLLEKGFRLAGEYIDRLREFEIHSVWIEFPDLDEVDALINERISAGHLRLYEALQSSLVEIKGRVAVEMNLCQYKAAIEQILVEIVNDPSHEVLTHQLVACSTETAGHLANCCYLSLLIGAHMSGYLRQQRRALPAHVAEDTRRLGIAALLHDIGKVSMPPELRRVMILDPESASPEYRAHCTAGYERVQGCLPGLTANVILNHHQRYDGSGFPERMDRMSRTLRPPPLGDQIHIFARIVGAVDVFDHLLSCTGRRLPTIIALGEIESKFRGWFDPQVVETLTRLVPPFMVGSVVQLSDARHAVVLQNHLEAPCRPTVRILTGSVYERGSRVQGAPLDLRFYRNLHVARIDGTDVTRYLFEPALYSSAPS